MTELTDLIRDVEISPSFFMYPWMAREIFPAEAGRAAVAAAIEREDKVVAILQAAETPGFIPGSPEIPTVLANA